MPDSLYFSFYKNLVEKNVKLSIELKNNVEIIGNLTFIDDKLNFHLNNIEVKNSEKYPHYISMKNIHIRGSSIRYVHLPS